jgi:hypothetical protein
MGKVKRFGNNLFTKLVNRMTRLKMSDTQCGFRAYGKEALQRLVVFGDFTYTQEVFLDLAYKNVRITEVPIAVRPRLKGRSKVVKNPFSYGLRAIKIILLAERDHRPLRFFGAISGVFLLLSLIAGSIVTINWLMSGMTTPYSGLIMISGILGLIGISFLVLALAVDMLGREKAIQEEILYLMRKNK